MKACFKCGRCLALTEFYKHPMMEDGHLGKCKDCTKRDAVLHYRAKADNPEWLAKERARGRDKYARYKYKPIGKRRAHNLVNSAVRFGRLAKPDWCRLCWTQGGKIEGHHEDYSKPLEVVWLCRSCHGLTKRKHRMVPIGNRAVA